MARQTRSEKPRAFVLISFDQEFDAVYSELIKKPLEEVGFVVERADSQLNQRSILQDIVRGIASADLIVADLSDMNPNVMYELGLAHALEIPTILLTQNINELPFDLRAYRANEYSVHFSEAAKIQDAVRTLGDGRISGDLQFGSPVTDYLPPELRSDRQPGPSGGEMPVVAGRQPPADGKDQQEEEDEEEDSGAWFDTLRAAEEANDRLLQAMERITAATGEVGEKITAHSVELDSINASNEPSRAKRTSGLFIRLARDLDLYAEQLEAEIPIVDENATANLNATSEYLAWLHGHSDLVSEAEVRELEDSVSGLFDATHESLGSTREFRNTVDGLRGVSRPINSASKRVVRALDGLISTMETIESQASRVLSTSADLLSQREIEPDRGSEADAEGGAAEMPSETSQ